MVIDTGIPGSGKKILSYIRNILHRDPAEMRTVILTHFPTDRIAGLTCIHLPGHTPGSIGMLDEKTGTLFAGDLLRWDSMTLSEGPVGFTMDLAASRTSIRKIASLSFDTLLIGHGKPLRPGSADKVRKFAESLSPSKKSRPAFPSLITLR